MSIRRMTLGSVVFAGVALVGSSAAAFACTNLAMLNLSSATGKAGDTVTVTGSSFRMPANVTTGIQVKWNGVDGAVLNEVRPDRAGNFSTTITVPESQPGYYVITAVLRDARGIDVSGTPARAQFQVLGGAAKPVPAPAAAQLSSGATGSSAGSAVPGALVAGLGVLGLVLFGAGFVAAARIRRPVPAAAKAPVRRD